MGAGGADSALGVALPMLEAATVLGRRLQTGVRVAGAALLAWLLGLLLAACSEAPVNSPYVRGAEAGNVLYTAFSQRSPKYLDPASSYSADETPFTYSIYEPLYGYDYLARPYQLRPRAAREISRPAYYDADGNRLADDAPGETIALSVYDIEIQPGILFQPHPAFARDASGNYAYWPITARALEDKYAISDFALTGTRELTADDYV